MIQPPAARSAAPRPPRPAAPPDPRARAAAAGRGRAAGTAAALALVAWLATGCDERIGTDRSSVVERAAALAPEIERAAGLRFTTPARVEVRTREQVRGFLERSVAEPRARAELQAQQALWRRLGVVPDTLDLQALVLRVLGEQVVGYYDAPGKTLYLVQGADSAAAEVTLRHELVHALQDQHRNLDSLLHLDDDADRSAAIHAALEGQATWVQLGLSQDLASRMPGAWDRVRQSIRENMDRMPELGAAPLIVRETLLFPYLGGAELARAVAGTGHPDSLLWRLPTSTEQVLHPPAYLGAAGRRPDAPITVALPRPAAGAVSAESTVGEFETRLIVYHHTNDLSLAARAAAGWGGDRWMLVRTPAGEALAWLTVWDSGTDAAEFFEAMGQVVPARYRGARPVAAPGAGVGGTTRVFAADAAAGGARTVTVRALDVQGRPAVLYLDAPSGAPAAPFDPARATLRR